MYIKDIFTKEEFEGAIAKVIAAREAQVGRINQMLDVKYVDCDIENQEIWFEFPIYEWELNPFDALHGGLSATMADYAMGICAFALGTSEKVGGTYTLTINMGLSYLKPMPIGNNVLAKVKVTSVGRSILTFLCELYVKETEELTITANATFKVLRK